MRISPEASEHICAPHNLIIDLELIYLYNTLNILNILL
jgi:hypothetical protein